MWSVNEQSSSPWVSVNIFINDPEHDRKRTLSRFAEGKKGGVVDMTNGRAIFQRDLDILEV